MRPTVYIAGPYSSDPENNTQAAMRVWFQLADMGFAPFCPHLTHYLHLMSPRNYEFWMAVDQPYVETCDALFRIQGHSKGADREYSRARRLGKPIFHSVPEAKEWLDKHTESVVSEPTTPEPEKRVASGESVLEEAQRLVYGDRNKSYGHPSDDYSRTVGIFNAMTGRNLTTQEGVLFMLSVKLSREMHRHGRDNLVDLAGYAACLDRIYAEETPDST